MSAHMFFTIEKQSSQFLGNEYCNGMLIVNVAKGSTKQKTFLVGDESGRNNKIVWQHFRYTVFASKFLIIHKSAH